LVVLLKEKTSYSRVINNNSISQGKQVYYFSMEFLIGRLLHNYLVNFQMENLVRVNVGGGIFLLKGVYSGSEKNYNFKLERRECMEIAFVIAEANPFVKTGGLGEVGGSLPAFLHKQGMDVRVIMPKYSAIAEHFRREFKYLTHFEVPVAYTITTYNEMTGTGNGFSFANYNAHDLLFAVQRAVKIYQTDQLVWGNIRQNALTSDFGWDRSANAYIEIYESLS